MAQTAYRSTLPADVDLYSVDDVQKYAIGQKCRATDKTVGYGEFIYLKGVANCVEGFAVTYEEDGTTTALAADAKGPVGFALAATVADKYGWFQILGKAAVKCVANSADNGWLGRETTDGNVGDGYAAGDRIFNVIARSATDTPATGFCWAQIWGPPYVMDGVAVTG